MGLEITLLLIRSSNGADVVENISNVRVIRMLRLTRFVRMLRIPRLIRFVGALRTMVLSVLLTLKTLLWAFVLLLLIMYMFALVFTQLVIDARAAGYTSDVLERHYGHIYLSLLTLFQTITNGVSWQQVAEPLGSEVSVFALVLFLTYVYFSQFALINVITGIFCNSAIESANRNPDMVAESLVASKREYVERIRTLFGKLDIDGSGQITVDDLGKLMSDETMQAYFEALGLEVSDSWQLFKILDEDRSNIIDVEEFIMGCMRLKGGAKNVDLVKMNSDQRWFMGSVSQKLKVIDDHVAQVAQHLGMKRGVDVAQFNKSDYVVNKSDYVAEEALLQVNAAVPVGRGASKPAA
eukprot:TRINITY_DN7664_c0_g1_i2.p1 TRINITY_DN7664_c0_g1~~TRINITY_DN7664_c0_g1_i2.p1  ORF type:complete len:352 (+),score=70.71 TRINITY_DN7664_c0_g1_i2:1095-2150(+)